MRTWFVIHKENNLKCTATENFNFYSWKLSAAKVDYEQAIPCPW